MSVEEHVPLARYTTIGTGGPARFFAKPATLDELHTSLRWAREEGHAVETAAARRLRSLSIAPAPPASAASNSRPPSPARPAAACA